jgi:hypothetical protein
MGKPGEYDTGVLRVIRDRQVRGLPQDVRHPGKIIEGERNFDSSRESMGFVRQLARELERADSRGREGGPVSP